MNKIEGVWGTMLLPLRKSGDVDFKALEGQIRILAGSGLNGIYSNGTAGEFWTLSEKEFDRTSGLMAGICREAGLPFQIGACHQSPHITRQRIQRTRKLGPVAYQVIIPEWVTPTMEELIEYFHVIGEAAGPVKLVLYNPPHAKWRLQPAEIHYLSRNVPELAGFKLAGGDADWFSIMRPVLESHAVFTPGHTLASDLPRGSRGSYSNMACLSPRGAARWYRLMKEDPSAAREIEDRIQTFRNAHIVPLWRDHKYSSAAIDKLWAYLGDWGPISTALRWPYRGVPESLGNELRSQVRTMIPDFF